MVKRTVVTDASVFVYTLGVVITGIFLADRLAADDRWLQLGIAVLVAAAWTVYFRYTMYDRLEEEPTDGESGSGGVGSGEAEPGGAGPGESGPERTE